MTTAPYAFLNEVASLWSLYSLIKVSDGLITGAAIFKTSAEI